MRKIRIVMASAAALALALVGLTGTTPASAATLGTVCSDDDCNGLPSGWSTERAIRHWGAYLTGSSVENANCTNYAAWRASENGAAYRVSHNANQWDSDAINVWNVPVDANPAVGDVAQTDNGAYGHVAYVEEVYSDGKILVSESNWNGKWINFRVVNASAFQNYIHFGGATGTSTGASKVFSPGDFDGDGHVDVIRVAADGALVLFAGNGAGGWTNAGGTPIGSGFSTAKTVFGPGDFNGDGFKDVMAIWPDGIMKLYTGNGAGGWLNGNGIAVGSGFSGFTGTYSAGDFNGDGFPDVAALTSAGALKLFTGNGVGGWLNGNGISFGSGFTGATAPRNLMFPGDFNGDARPDMIALYSDGSLNLFAGNGTGGWSNGTGVRIGGGFSAATSVTSPGDFNGDGKVDILASWPDGSLKLYTGNGTGGWLNGNGITISAKW